MNVLVHAPNFKDFNQSPNKGDMNLVVHGVLPAADAVIIDPRQRFPDVGYMGDLPRIVATPSTGTNHIDLDRLKTLGVKLLTLKDDQEALNKITASSEFTLQLLLEAFRSQKRELSGKKILVVGLGRIGSNVLNYLEVLKCDGWVHDPPMGIGEDSDLPNAVAQTDGMVICCELNDNTRGMINDDVLQHANDEYVVVNTARGAVVDTHAMARFCNYRPKRRYYTDVAEVTVGATFMNHNYRYTGHVAGDTKESNKKAADIILGLIKDELDA